MNLARTALLTIDLQNDFLHPEGAYGRAGQSADAIAQLPDRIKPLRDTSYFVGLFREVALKTKIMTQFSGLDKRS